MTADLLAFLNETLDEITVSPDRVEDKASA
jgi:hypothetical protein